MNTPEELELAKAQADRAPLAAAEAKRNIESVLGNDAAVAAQLKLARRANRRLKQVKLVLVAASMWAEPIAKHAACRKGCAHCCHIPAAVTAAEAALLAATTGRAMVVPPNARRLVDMDLTDLQNNESPGPCPFLVDGSCSAYDARPAICRLHLNLDVDDLLCRVVPGIPAAVPYVNKLPILGECLQILDREVVADIREFFPES